MTPIDLRSDTVTQPTPEMLEAMSRAEYRDEPRDGDPSVKAFEALAAERTGKEAALFVASGTMGNLLAQLAHTARGGEVLAEGGVHILNSEMGGIATLAGLMPRPLSGTRGAMDLKSLRSAIKPNMGPHRSGTALVAMETSHNKAGGSVLPLEHMAAVYKLAQDNGVPVHTDGARLFNAAVALGVGADRIGAYTDSICFCVSKGLSAPVGAILAGPASFIERARGFRRMVGGNLRQPGPLAAAGLVALKTMVSRLAEDHETARQLAKGLNGIDPSLADPDAVETNLVRVEVDATGHDAGYWSAEMEKRGVLVAPYGDTALRFVTHRHITADDVRAAVRAFADVWAQVSDSKRNHKAAARAA